MQEAGYYNQTQARWLTEEINPKIFSWKINVIFQYCGLFRPSTQESVKWLCQRAKQVFAQMRGFGTESWLRTLND